MRYLLDSNSANDYIHRKHGVFDRAKKELLLGHVLGTTVPVLAELVAGIELSQSRDRNIKKLQQAMHQLRLWPFDELSAYQYGKLHAELKTKGSIIGKIDIMIAAVAITLPPCTVVTTDQDFQAIPGLRVQNWRE